MINKNADVTLKNNDGDSAITWSNVCGDKGIKKLLTDNGAKDEDAILCIIKNI